MQVNVKDLPDLFEKHWFTVNGLVIAEIVVLIVFGSVLGSLQPGLVTSFGIIVAASAVIVFLWWYSRRVPRTKKGRIGFMVAISSNDDEESNRLREDFLHPLRRALFTSQAGKLFQFFELKPHLSDRIHAPQDADAIRRKARVMFLLYGRIRIRTVNGEERHYLELDGIVAHRPIREGTKKSLERDFCAFLPQRINFTRENDLFKFQLTSDWTSIVARYIIGLAIALSGHMDVGESLYDDALRDLKAKGRQLPVYKKLIRAIPVRKSELYEARAMIAQTKWKGSHQAEDAQAMANALRNVLRSHLKDPPMALLAAISAFINERDARGAMQILNEVKRDVIRSRNSELLATWRYSVAFLNAYVGNLWTAQRYYVAASLERSTPDVIAQVEDFIVWILEVEPDKYQFHLCLALLNWKTKGDLLSAQADFERFLEQRPPGQFDKEAGLVATWLTEIRAEQATLPPPSTATTLSASALADTRPA